MLRTVPALRARAGLWACMVATYAFAVFCRLAVVDHAAASTFDVTTADAYGWLAAVSGWGRFNDHLLARTGQLLIGSGSLQLETLALYGPVVVSALAAPLLTYWGWTRAEPAAGIFAGILGMQLPAVYARTGFGYFDSDPVIIPLLLCITLVFDSWALFAARARSGSTAWAVFALSVGLGLALYLASKVHVLFLFNTVVLVLVAAWLYPQTRLPGIYVVATGTTGPAGLAAASLLQLWLVRRGDAGRALEDYLRDRPALCAASLAAVAAAALAVLEVTGVVDVASRFRTYLYRPLADLLGAGSESVPVRELARVDAVTMLQLLTGNVYLSVLGTAAAAAALMMNRSLAFFLFPLMLGLSAPLTGQRFVVFGALVIAAGSAIVLARLARNLFERHSMRIGLLSALGALYGYQLFGIYAAEPPQPYGSREVKELLASVNDHGDVKGCDLILASWGQGYLASFYTGLPGILDGSSHPAEAVQAYGRMMMSSGRQDLERHLCQLVTRQSSFIEEQSRRYECGGPPGEGARLYWLVTWRNVLDAKRWAGYRGGEQPAPPAYVLDGPVPSSVLQQGAIRVGESVYHLASAVVVGHGGVEARDYSWGSAWHLIVNRAERNALLVDRTLYQAFFTKAFTARGGEGFPVEIRRNGAAVILEGELGELCSLQRKLK